MWGWYISTVINFVLDAGSKFEGIATIQNEDGTLFDLTGYNIYSQMKKSFYSNRNVVDISATIYGDPIEGNILLELKPSQTQELPTLMTNNWIYDIEVHDPSDANNTKRVAEGIITVNPNATKIPI